MVVISMNVAGHRMGQDPYGRGVFEGPERCISGVGNVCSFHTGDYTHRASGRAVPLTSLRDVQVPAEESSHPAGCGGPGRRHLLAVPLGAHHWSGPDDRGRHGRSAIERAERLGALNTFLSVLYLSRVLHACIANLALVPDISLPSES